MVAAVVGDFDPDEVEKIFHEEMGEIIPKEPLAPYLEKFSPLSLKIVDRKEVKIAGWWWALRLPGY